MKKLLALLLAALMVCSVFAGCGDDKKDKNTADGDKDPNSFFGGDKDKPDSSQTGSEPLDPSGGTADTPVTPDPKPDDPVKPDDPTTPSDIPGGSGDTPANPDTPVTPDPKPDTPPAPSGDPYVQGKSTTFTWVNEWADMRFDTANTVYEVSPDFIYGSADQEGRHKEMMAYNIEGTGECIYVYVLERKEGQNTPDELLSGYHTDRQKTHTVSDITDITIAGRTFRTFRAKANNQNSFNVAYAAASEGDYLIYIYVAYRSEKTPDILFGFFSKESEHAAPADPADDYEQGTCTYAQWGSKWAGLECMPSVAGLILDSEAVWAADKTAFPRLEMAANSFLGDSSMEIYVEKLKYPEITEREYLAQFTGDALPWFESFTVGGKTFSYGYFTETSPYEVHAAYKQGEYMIHMVMEFAEKGEMEGLLGTLMPYDGHLYDHAPLPYTQGFFNEAQWASEWATLEFIAPSDIFMVPEDLIPADDDEEMVTEFMAADLSGQRAVYVFVDRPFDPWTTGEDYLAEIVNSGALGGSVTTNGIYGWDVDGIAFDRVDAPAADGKGYDCWLAYAHNEHMIVIYVKAPDVGLADMLLGSFERYDGEIMTERLTSADGEDDYVRGYVDQNYWGSEWIGLEVTLPRSYAMSTDQELEQNMLESADLLYKDLTPAERQEKISRLTTVYEMMASDPYGNNLIITVEKLAVDTNEATYIELVKMNLETVSEVANYSGIIDYAVGGHEYKAAAWQVTMSGVAVEQLVMVRQMGGRMVAIIITAADELGFNEMIESIDVFDGVPNDAYTVDSGLTPVGSLQNGIWTAEEWNLFYKVPAGLNALADEELYDLVGYGSNETAYDLLVYADEQQPFSMSVISILNYSGETAFVYAEIIAEGELAVEGVKPAEGGRGTEEIQGKTFEKMVLERPDGQGNVYQDTYYVTCIGDRVIVINILAKDAEMTNLFMSGFSK